MSKQHEKSTTLARINPLAKQLEHKEFRDSYLKSHVKLFLATQIRSLRGKRSQAEFAKMLGTKQSVISRYENPEYGQVTLQTLLDIATKLDIALVARFTNYVDFLHTTSDFSKTARTPKAYDKADVSLMKEELEQTHATVENNKVIKLDFSKNSITTSNYEAIPIEN